jgi:putative DNA primase/helicase
VSDKRMVDIAIFLGGRGIAVFPLFTIDDGACSCGNPKCGSPGKHPLTANGVLNATTDRGLILEWWATYPDANIGIATGDASGIVVLDIDAKSGGEETLTNLEQRNDMLPDTWAVETGGGGLHFYFQMPNVDVRNSAGAIGPGIDVRGNGGYVVAPPSLHVSGERYAWSERLHPRLIPYPAPVPHWLLVRMATRTAQRQVTVLPSTIKEGERNTWMTSAAGAMRRNGFSGDAIYAAIAVENKRRCQPPLDDHEVRRIATSVERYPPETILRARAV